MLLNDDTGFCENFFGRKFSQVRYSTSVYTVSWWFIIINFNQLQCSQSIMKIDRINFSKKFQFM